MSTENETQLRALTADILGKFLGNPNNTATIDDIGRLTAVIRGSLTGGMASTGEVVDDVAVSAATLKQEPAVPVKKSVFPDYIICLEDGRKLKMLKRHLRSFGLSPDTYRAKWGLPDDYPMVAATYAKHRSELAKQIGLGHTSRTVEDTVAEVVETAPPAPVEVQVEAPKQPRRVGKAPEATKPRKAGVRAARK
jgi:predicted transcriptional regulator